MNKAKLRRKIWELDFAIHEMVLFLDTHKNNTMALNRLKMYKREREMLVREYVSRFGSMNETANASECNNSWCWLDGPWPWENKFAEE